MCSLQGKFFFPLGLIFSSLTERDTRNGMNEARRIVNIISRGDLHKCNDAAMRSMNRDKFRPNARRLARVRLIVVWPYIPRCYVHLHQSVHDHDEDGDDGDDNDDVPYRIPGALRPISIPVPEVRY